MRRLTLVFALVLVPAASWAQGFQLPQPAPLVVPRAPVAPVVIYTPTPATVVGTDGTYLGTLSNNPYDANSTANPYGRYGSPYSADSVNNPYGKYGSPYSADSARNPYTTTAPLLVAPDGTTLGRLSANPYAVDSTSNPYSTAGSVYSATSVNNPYSPYYVPPVKKQ